MLEIIAGIYIAIGLLIAIWRLSKVTPEEDVSAACIGGVFILFFYPLYLLYKVIKKNIHSGF